MTERDLDALSCGGTLIALNSRLASQIRAEYSAHQRERGRAIWTSPDVLPLGAFLARCWQEGIYRNAEPGAALLNSAQSSALWERVIREAEGDSLLQVEQAARASMHSWTLAHAYRLRLDDGRFAATDDASAFRGWGRAYERLCRAEGWIDEARLPDAVADLFRARSLKLPGPFLLAGFDELTPQQEELAQALGDVRRVECVRHSAVFAEAKLPDSVAEIRAAAEWARELLGDNPKAHIGIIVPGLASLHRKVERIFREVLHPADIAIGDAQAFHVASGTLIEQPFVQAAFTALQMTTGPIRFSEASALVRSPFVGGAEDEVLTRSLDDVRLRRRAPWKISVQTLRVEMARSPELQNILGKFWQMTSAMPDRQRTTPWSATFSRALQELDWPGERALNGREQQTVEAWRELLSKFATLDAIVGELTRDEALARLRRLASATRFNGTSEGAPIEILQPTDAQGLRFDHLWISGLHEDAFRAMPDAFLPLVLQREHNLPNANPQARRDSAQKLFTKLIESAPDVVLSWPEVEGEQHLARSPLLNGVSFARAIPPSKAHPAVPAPLEGLEDWRGPSLPEQTAQLGGTSLFKDMSACSFRAFARFRLNARPLDDPEFGITARDQGSVVHNALRAIWAELKTQQQLSDMSGWALSDLIAAKVKDAIPLQITGLFREVEQERVERLIREWLDLERQREPFAVVESERKRNVEFGGLLIEIRMDRVDELRDGRHVILDYKTGALKGSCWYGERPDEPQVPLYCVTHEAPIAAALFAQVCTGQLAFRGVAERTVIPQFKTVDVEKNVPLAQLIAGWDVALTRLAEDYRAGVAEADPKKSACTFCHLEPICRIREAR